MIHDLRFMDHALTYWFAAISESQSDFTLLEIALAVDEQERPILAAAGDAGVPGASAAEPIFGGWLASPGGASTAVCGIC